MRTAAQPHLYDAESDVPILKGVVCELCGRAYFPPIGIGCEICGAPAEHLDSQELEAAGTIHSLAEVHFHRGSPPPPFTIAEIVLDGGPLIRALVHPDAGALQIGDRVEATWYLREEDESGGQTVEPAFVLVDLSEARS